MVTIKAVSAGGVFASFAITVQPHLFAAGFRVKSYHRTGLCLRSNRSLFVAIYFAGKGFFEARDWRVKNPEVGKNGAPRDWI
jgi:hypothetical protein